MVGTCRDGDNVGNSRRDVQLAVSVYSPNPHCPVVFESDAMLVATGNGDDIAQASRNKGRLNVVEVVKVPSPCHYGAILSQGQAVNPTACHSNHVTQAKWNIGLANIRGGVRKPGCNRAVNPDRESVCMTASN